MDGIFFSVVVMVIKIFYKKKLLKSFPSFFLLYYLFYFYVVTMDIAVVPDASETPADFNISCNSACDIFPSLSLSKAVNISSSSSLLRVLIICNPSEDLLDDAMSVNVDLFVLVAVVVGF